MIVNVAPIIIAIELNIIVIVIIAILTFITVYSVLTVS